MTQLGNNVFTGTLVKDDLEDDLFAPASGTDVVTDLAGTSTGSYVPVYRPGDVAFVLELGPVTGTSPTLSAVVQGSDTTDFSDDVVTYATLSSSGNTADNSVYSACAEVYKTYVRAVVTLGGTSPVYDGATLKVRQPHWHRTSDTTAAPLV